MNIWIVHLFSTSKRQLIVLQFLDGGSKHPNILGELIRELDDESIDWDSELRDFVRQGFWVFDVFILTEYVNGQQFCPLCGVGIGSYR